MKIKKLTWEKIKVDGIHSVIRSNQFLNITVYDMGEYITKKYHYDIAQDYKDDETVNMYLMTKDEESISEYICDFGTVLKEDAKKIANEHFQKYIHNTIEESERIKQYFK